VIPPEESFSVDAFDELLNGSDPWADLPGPHEPASDQVSEPVRGSVCAKHTPASSAPGPNATRPSGSKPSPVKETEHGASSDNPVYASTSTGPDNPLRYLFLDLNSYFASVEQQLNPELRGKPVAVVPMLVDSSSCVAASYEAKRFGVKTGTRIYEARQMCPGIHFVKARHRAYIEMHHRIISAVDACMPVEQVMSIDEMACRLSRAELDPAAAVDMAKRIKQSITTRVGECLRCSIGIAPNRFLAKVATDMQKPDGLVVLQQCDLPEALFNLELQDMCGIGSRMAQRLKNFGIHTVAELCRRPEHDLEKVWGGVVGRYWYRWLRGYETDHRPTRRRSVGHQHVLGPDSRSDTGAYAVVIRLLHKAASRMRHLGYFAQRMALSVGVWGDRNGAWGATPAARRTWSAHVLLEGGKQDTMTLLAALSKLWESRPAGTPRFVGVTLFELLPASSVTAPLFPQDRQRETLSKLIDTLDASYGPLTVYTAAMHEARKKAGGGIAFQSIPDLQIPDSIG